MRRSENEAERRGARPRVVRLGMPPAELVARLAQTAARDDGLVRLAQRLLAPLLDDDRARGGDLMATLRAYYACGASVGETADALFLHRNSVRYRLDRVRAMLGLDIDAPANIAGLLAAFALLDAAQEKVRVETLGAQ